MLDVSIAIAVVYAWDVLYEPGHAHSYYLTAGIPIARRSTRTAGTALIFAASWLTARREPKRNALLFALLLVRFYAAFDGATVAFHDFFTASVAFTMGLKLVAALAGAIAAKRGPRPAVV